MGTNRLVDYEQVEEGRILAPYSPNESKDKKVCLV